MVAEITMYPWRFAAAPFHIAGNLYYVGNTNVSSHLIDTGEGLILLDTAFPQTVYLLLESIRRLGFDPSDIKLILHTHGHYDHFGGTRAIVELTGARTYLGAEDIEILGDKPELSWAPEYGVEFYETFEVDVPLSDGDTVELGNTTIECVHIPGHMPGAMGYFFEVTDAGQTYRVGLHGAPGRNTLTDEYLQGYGLSLDRRAEYLSSLQRLKGERVDIQIGAHPDQADMLGKAQRMTAEDNPFIDPRSWGRFLDGLETGFREAFSIGPDVEQGA